MRVLIDGHMIGSNEGGNERYTKNLFLSLIKNEKENISILVGEKGRGIKRKQVIVRRSASNNIFRLLYLIPSLVNPQKIDVVHSNYISPFYKNSKFVITVHDFCFKYYPQYFSLRERIIFNFLLPYSLKFSDSIIVPSEFTKKELLKFYPQYRGKAFVIYEAAEDIFHYIPKKKAEEIIAKTFKLKSPFLLALNGKNPKKNINRIIEAYLRVQKQFPELKLVIVGNKFNIEKKYMNNKGIIILGKIKDAKLNVLYNAAEIFIYYSVYEGFGLPVLEALKCKALVVCSDIEVLREIAKNNVVYENPFNERDLAKKIATLLKNKDYAEKIRRKSTGVNKIYSWENTARETLKIYKLLDKKWK